jgi:FkbM family methyltransferase
MQLPGYNQIKQCKEGWLLYNKNDQYIGKSIGTYGEYSDSESVVFKQIIPERGLVFDVGANIGAHTVTFAKIVGPLGVVIAYEPQRLIYQTLCANVAINSLTNVYCRNEAVGAAKGELLLPVFDPEISANFGGVAVEGHRVGEQVHVTTLDDSGAPACAFIKIDVEGMELKVLRGAKSLIAAHRPVLYVENDRRDRSDELIRYIDSIGYNMYWHQAFLYNPNNYERDPVDIFGIVSRNMLCLPKEFAMDVPGSEKVAVPAEPAPSRDDSADSVLADSAAAD